MSPPRRHRTSVADEEQEHPPSARRAKRARHDPDESEDGGSLGKTRMRVTRACNECRKRKDRCDGGRPACQPCLDAGRTCSYNPPKKRGLRTGYVRALEVLLGMIFNAVNHSDSWVSGLLDGQTWQPQFQLTDSGPDLPEHADACEVLVESWRKTHVLKQVERLLSVEPSENDDDADSNETFDSRIKQAIMLIDKVRNEQGSRRNHAPQIVSLQDTNQPLNSITVTEPAYKGSQPEADAIISHELAPTTQAFSSPEDTIMQLETLHSPHYTHFELPENRSALLETYFTDTHSWLPMFQKHEILRLAYLLDNEKQTTSTSHAMSHGDRCSLMAVLAYSATMAENREDRGCATALRTQVTKLFMEDLKVYEVGHVRAFLILALLNLSCGNKAAAWLAVGKATYAMTSLVPVQEILEGQSQIDEGLRRTFTCCFVLDTLVASWLGARPYFKRSDITKVGLLPTDSCEEWEPWQMRKVQGRVFLPQRTPGHIISTFNRFTQLVTFLNDMLRFRNNDRSNERMQELESALGNWNQQNSFETELSPQKFNLQLAYAGVSEALRAEKLRLIGIQLNIDNDSGFSRMHEHGRLLDQRMLSMGISSIPPTSTTYLACFKRSLDIQIQLQVHTMSKADMQALQTSVSELDQNHLQARKPINEVQENSTICRLDNKSGQDHSQSTGQNNRQDISLGFPTPGSSGISTQSLDRDAATYNGSGPGNSQASNYTKGTPQQGLFFQHSQKIVNRPSSFGSNFQVDPALEAASTEMDEDELFQSLANLDSADWSANPPEFMEHLGVLGDVTSDLQSFFDKDLG